VVLPLQTSFKLQIILCALRRPSNADVSREIVRLVALEGDFVVHGVDPSVFLTRLKLDDVAVLHHLLLAPLLQVLAGALVLPLGVPPRAEVG